MSQKVSVEKCTAADPNGPWERLNTIVEEIRQSAFSRFEGRGQTNGGDLDDWLRAEREVVWCPASELVEAKDDFQARVALAGFDAKDVKVTATPQALIIEAEKTHTHDAKEGDVRFCEFSDKKLLRRIELPTDIDIDKVTASLDNGMLRVNAPKAAQSKQLSASA
ncbi:MAG TPA: Hsp20 family protein [Bryobacteraceae bacterium]|nr:Hsp20 family protein [Bryobacteraceae bacterium]